MALTMAGDLVSGGWNALNNVISGIGTGVESVWGAVFPAQQRDTIKSETVQAAGGTGQTFRPTVQENQSMIETAKWSAAGWRDSPYQQELSVPAKQAESKQLAETIGPPTDPIGEGLEWALEQTKKATTLYDQLKNLWEPREVINETPREGYPDGKNVQHLNTIQGRGAELYSTVSGIYDQVKGLFNLGFDQTETQPVSPVTHELTPDMQTGLIVIGAVILLFLLLRK